MDPASRPLPLVQQHYGTLLRLKNYFPFSLIDACGTLEQCRVQIARELRYTLLCYAAHSPAQHMPQQRSHISQTPSSLKARAVCWHLAEHLIEMGHTSLHLRTTTSHCQLIYK